MKPKMSWNGKLERRIIASVATSTTLVALVTWFARDARYRFDTTTVTETSEVRCLAALAEDLGRILHQDPVTASPEAATAAANWVRLPSGSKADSWSDLLAPGTDPMLHHASLNGTLMVLAQHPREIKPADLRQSMTPEEAASLVLQVFRAHVEERRLRDAMARLADAGLDSIWERRVWAGWPQTHSGRWWLRWLVGRPDDGTQYANALLEDLRPVTRLAAWYDALAAFDEQPLGEPSAAGFWLVHDRTRPVVAEGWSARLDVRLDYRRPSSGDDRSNLIAATGLLMHGVRAEPATRQGLGTTIPRLLPATGQLSVDLPRFVAFLHACGLPEAFDVLEVNPRRTGDGSALAFAWDLTVRHREFESFVLHDTLDPTGAPAPALESAIHGLSVRVLSRFARDFRATREDRGWEVAVRDPKPDEPAGSLLVGLTSPSTGTLPFSVRVGEGGRLAWSDQARLADRRRVAALLAARIPQLAGLESKIRVYMLAYDRADRGRITGAFSLAGEKGQDHTTFKVEPDGRVQVEISEKRKVGLEAVPKPASRPSATPDDPATEPIVTLRTARAVIDRHYNPISPMVEVEPSPDGRSLTLGLRLADYPTLILGPVEVESREALGATIADLLSPRRVAEQAASDWSRTGPNPRWGTIRPSVLAWDPHQGRATIECRLTLSEKSQVVIPWNDDLRTEQGHWTSTNADQISALVAPHLDSLKESVRKLAATRNLELEVDVDTDAFGRGVWLQLHPATAAFRCRMEPYPGFGWKVGIERVLLDRAGLHLNPAFSFQLRASIPLPPPPAVPVMMLSDPVVRIDFVARDVTISGKFTPPFVATVKGMTQSVGAAALDQTCDSFGGLRIDNPWLYLAYLKAQIGGSLSKSNRELRGGADVTFLQSYDMASGQLSAWFPQAEEGGLAVPAIHGKLQAGLSASSNFPRLDGELWIDQQRGFETTARVQIAGLNLDGRPALRPQNPDGTDKPHAEFVGEGRFPVVGRVVVKGITDLEFRDPVFEASSTVPLAGFTGATLNYVNQVRRGGYTCHYV